jgi:MFS family permease
VFRKQPKEIVLTALLRLAEQSPSYIFNAFIFTYGTQVLGASRDLLLIGLITTTALGFMWVTVAGWLSDVIGRRRMYIVGCVSVAVFTFVYFAVLDTKMPVMIFIAVALSFIPVMTMYGPEAALIADLHAAAPLQRCLDRISIGRRSSPAVRRRSSQPGSLPLTTRPCRSASTLRSARSSASGRP